MSASATRSDLGRRPARLVRIYAFDPSASVTLDTAVLNDVTTELPGEASWQNPVMLGPVKDYIEAVDLDPADGLFDTPVSRIWVTIRPSASLLQRCRWRRW